MIEINVSGKRVQHTSQPPYRCEKFPSGLACILGADGINGIRFPDKPGAKLVYAHEADGLVDLFNKAATETRHE